MKYWIAVASKEHVIRGKKEGIAQVCHGKQNPLKQIKDKEPYPFKMSDDFVPWRRDVKFLKAKDIEIEPLINDLSFIKNKKHWGFVFRYGLFSIPLDDFKLIASNMGINV